jgi:hypothetical protein
MATKHDVARGPGGRPRDHSLDGTSRARGRTLRDAPTPPSSRAEQLVDAMIAADLTFEDALRIFNEVEDSLPPNTPERPDYGPEFALIQLASDYQNFERRWGRRLPVFTADELAAVVAGKGPNRAPWPPAKG